MPHKFLQAKIEKHPASPKMFLDSGESWGLVHKLLLVASQIDDSMPPTSHVTFQTDALISN
jgi:hypothetical protein